MNFVKLSPIVAHIDHWVCTWLANQHAE